MWMFFRERERKPCSYFSAAAAPSGDLAGLFELLKQNTNNFENNERSSAQEQNKKKNTKLEQWRILSYLCLPASSSIPSSIGREKDEG